MSTDASADGVCCPVFVVSLASSTDRRDAFAAGAVGAQTPWLFFDAFEDMGPDLSYDDRRAHRYYGRPLTKGELGCYSSHIALWELLLSGDAKQIIVLEDDVVVDWDMLSLLARTSIASLGVFYLRLHSSASARSIVHSRDCLRKGTSLLELTSRAYGTRGYVMTRAAAKRLVPFCRRVTRPIDDQLDRAFEHGVPAMALSPSVIRGNLSPSIIGRERPGKVRRPFVNHLLTLADRIRRDRAHWTSSLRVRFRRPAVEPGIGAGARPITS